MPGTTTAAAPHDYGTLSAVAAFRGAEGAEALAEDWTGEFEGRRRHTPRSGQTTLPYKKFYNFKGIKKKGGELKRGDKIPAAGA